jgi:hypothetical protein
MPLTAGKPVTAGPPATACSKGTAETPTTPLVTPGMLAIAERPATGNHQELKGRQLQQECLPLWMQATAVAKATTVMPATSNIKDDSNIITAYNSRNASNSMNVSNNRTANTVWTPLKAGMLTKSEAGMEGGEQQQRQ